MNLPSSKPKRSHRAGFTILEAMLAFAVLGIVLASVYTISIRSFRHQTDALSDYELSAMARAVLDEYVVTYPAMESSGTYEDRWSWIISEEPQPPLKPTSLDQHFSFVKITASVWVVETDNRPHELSTVVARRANSE